MLLDYRYLWIFLEILVTYIGAYTTDGQFEREMVREVYKRGGIEIENLPKGVYMEWREGFWVAVNYTGQTVNVPISDYTKILIGENPLPSASVVIWKDNK